MLDMFGQIDGVFKSVSATIYKYQGDYTGPGGAWEQTLTSTEKNVLINVQPVTDKKSEYLTGQGGGKVTQDLRKIYINDGNMIYPDQDGVRFVVEFDAGQGVKKWSVLESDSRPWRTRCRAYVKVAKE